MHPHVVRREKREAGVGPARAVRKDSITREHAEAAQTQSKRINVVRIGADARDHFGVAGLYRTQRTPQRHDAGHPADRQEVQPSSRHAEMLQQTHGGIWSERETTHRQSIDVALAQARCFQKARSPPLPQTYARYAWSTADTG
jgi:hypothetical protein